MASRLKLEFLTTGFWLGISQVALTFHLLYSQGASVVYYFALIFIWLFCSVLAIHLLNSDKFKLILKLISLITFCIAAYLARVNAFTSLSLVAVLVAVVSIGMFSGFFFKNSVEKYKNISSFLLYENNGFIAGYAIGGCLLFSSIMLVDIVAVISGFIILGIGNFPGKTEEV